MREFFRVLGAPWRALLDPEGRRGWALIALVLGGVALTTYSAFALYLVRGNENFAFYLGLAAMVSTDIILTGLAGLLIKRSIKGSVLGNSFEISDEQTQAIAKAVVDATPPPPPPPPAQPITIVTSPAPVITGENT